MAIVVALIITLILLAKFGVNKANESYYSAEGNRTFEERKARRDNFENKYTDAYFESDCKDEVRRCTEKANSVRQKVIDETGVKPSGYMILMAMMAEKCKIPWILTSGNIANRYIDTKMTMRGKDEKMFEYCRFMKWYNKTLIENGMDDDELYYASLDDILEYDKTHLLSSVTPIRVADMEPQRCGEFFWGSTQSYTYGFASKSLQF